MQVKKIGRHLGEMSTSLEIDDPAFDLVELWIAYCLESLLPSIITFHQICFVDSFGAEAEARASKGRRRVTRGTTASTETLVLSGARRLRNRKIFAPSSPARAEDPLLGKRKGQQASQGEDAAPTKRPRSNPGSGEDGERSVTETIREIDETVPQPLIECPEEDCSKKYRHSNGLRYHQTHAHRHSQHTIANSKIYGPKDLVCDDTPDTPVPTSQRKHPQSQQSCATTQGAKSSSAETQFTCAGGWAWEEIGIWLLPDDKC